jgi:predicted transcriptional regulator YdeE
MNLIERPTIYLIGLALKHQTTNTNGQAALDCGNTWQEFARGNYAQRIPGKVSEAIFAVYHDYVSDYTEPYSYFIGCEVQDGTEVPSDLDSLTIPAGTYQQIKLQGQIPNMVAEAWQEIWKSDIKRAYRPDFAVYDERSQDWKNAEANIFLSVIG